MKTGISSNIFLRLLLTNLIPVILISLTISDLIEAINHPGAYPFGSSINSYGSIYSSKFSYITYQGFTIIILALLIAFSFFYKKSKSIYFALLAIVIILMIYPMLTGRD